MQSSTILGAQFYLSDDAVNQALRRLLMAISISTAESSWSHGNWLRRDTKIAEPFALVMH